MGSIFRGPDDVLAPISVEGLIAASNALDAQLVLARAEFGRLGHMVFRIDMRSDPLLCAVVERPELAYAVRRALLDNGWEVAEFEWQCANEQRSGYYILRVER